MPNRPLVRSQVGGIQVWREASGPGVSELYFARSGGGIQLRTGEPLADREAWLYGPDGSPISSGQPGGVIGSPQPKNIIYEPVPTGISLASGPVQLRGRYFRRVEPGVAFDFGKIGGYGSPHRLSLVDCIVRANGSAFAGYRNRLHLKNCVVIVDPPTVKGTSAARPISMQEFYDCELENVTFIGGSQNYFSGLNGKFAGNAGLREGFKAIGVRYHNPDGRRSDGNGGYIRSNWANGHANDPDRIANAGEIGWDITNFAQFNNVNGMYLDVRWVEVLCELGRSRTEDTLSLYGGTGGSQAIPGLFEDCLLDSSGGYDWNYIPGVSASYDASNQVTANATSFQDVSKTRSSGTSIIIGDAARTKYEDNSSYITLRRVIGIGARPLIGNDYAHHITYENCETYLMAKHWSGVPYVGYHDGFYQIRPKTTTAAYTAPDGTVSQRQIFGAISFFNNIWGTPDTVAPTPFSLSAAQMQDGGQQGNNLKVPSPADGGAQIIRDFRARAAAQGVQIGAYLSHPIGHIADVFEKI